MPRLTPGQMVALPWQWQGPTQERDEHANEWWELRIAELPEFFVAAESESEVIAQAASALEAFLASFLNRGETPPLPALPKLQGAFPDQRDDLEPYARVRELQVA